MNSSSSIIRKVAELAHHAPSADNTQPWRMEWDGRHLAIFYDTPRVAGTTFPPNSPGSLLSIGALIENIMTVAANWELHPEIAMAEIPGDNPAAPYARIALTPPPDCNRPRELHPLVVRHTNRGRYTRQSVPGVICSELAQGREDRARTWVNQEEETRARVAGLVKNASLIRFQTREVHEWLGRSLRFTPASAAAGDGLDVATLGLPPGGGSMLRLISDWNRMRLLNKLGMHRLLAAIDSAPVGAGPGVLAIIAPPGPHDAIAAGRLLARQWLLLNRNGLAVHPYYVVADQLARLVAGNIPVSLEPIAHAVAAETRDLFGLSGDETLHMLLRVGFPKGSPKQSQRLPLDRVYHDISPAGG